jgi:hypothetical protein
MATLHSDEASVYDCLAGIIGDLLIGPYEPLPRFSGASYLHFVRDELPQLLEDVPLAKRQTVQFIHDGAPVHFAHDVNQFLDSHYTY